MAKRDHVHKYRRDKLGKQFIYRCGLPGCPHYILAKLVLGRISLCNYCDAQFVIDKHNAKLKNPHCPNCIVAHNAKPKQQQAEETLAVTTADFLEKILPSISRFSEEDSREE